jgi:hypothetical protein
MPPGVREFQFIARSGNKQVSWSKVKTYPFVEIGLPREQEPEVSA